MHPFLIVVLITFEVYNNELINSFLSKLVVCSTRSSHQDPDPLYINGLFLYSLIQFSQFLSMKIDLRCVS